MSGSSVDGSDPNHAASQAGGTQQVSCTVNGEPVVLDVTGTERLAAVLRNQLGLTGTKLGCEVGVCGACTVLVDERPTSACITLMTQVDGCDVVTIEGLAHRAGIDRLQAAFVEEGGFQCGFCTSGQLVSAASLLASGRVPTMDDDELAESLHGSLCRCTGYYGIMRAIRKAAQ